MINLFPTSIYVEQLDTTDFKSAAEFLLSELDKINANGGVDSTGFTTGDATSMYRAERNLQNYPQLKSITDQIEFHLQQYWNRLNFSPYLVPKIHNMWSNISNKTGSTTLHNHGGFPLAGVCYIQKDFDGMGDIYFVNPNELIVSQQPYNEDIWFSVTEQEVSSRTGDLILFPGWLKHGVRKNKTDSARIVLGFDVAMVPVDNAPQSKLNTTVHRGSNE